MIGGRAPGLPARARRARARLPTNCYNGILNGLAQRADGDACASVFEDMRLLSVEPTEGQELL